VPQLLFPQPSWEELLILLFCGLLILAFWVVLLVILQLLTAWVTALKVFIKEVAIKPIIILVVQFALGLLSFKEVILVVSMVTISTP